MNASCYKFNGGRDAAKQITAMHKTYDFGRSSGFKILFSVPTDGYVTYHASDNRDQPVHSEIMATVQPGRIVFVGLTKTVDIKLPRPYSDCTQNINNESSDLVKEIIQQNITYRKANCYNMCYLSYLSEYARLLNISKALSHSRMAFNGNCSHLCPLECQTRSFEATENSLNLSGHPNLHMNFFYWNNRHTEMTQVAKTIEVDLISNTGGVFSLFLELSFLRVFTDQSNFCMICLFLIILDFYSS